jgi:hypothetical protein
VYSSGISTSEMYGALLKPLFLIMIILMFGTAITELFTGQWIDVLLKNVTDNAILLLTIETGVMVLGRAFAGPVVHRFRHREYYCSLQFLHHWDSTF